MNRQYADNLKPNKFSTPEVKIDIYHTVPTCQAKTDKSSTPEVKTDALSLSVRPNQINLQHLRLKTDKYHVVPTCQAKQNKSNCSHQAKPNNCSTTNQADNWHAVHSSGQVQHTTQSQTQAKPKCPLRSTKILMARFRRAYSANRPATVSNPLHKNIWRLEERKVSPQ